MSGELRRSRWKHRNSKGAREGTCVQCNSSESEPTVTSTVSVAGWIKYLERVKCVKLEPCPDQGRLIWLSRLKRGVSSSWQYLMIRWFGASFLMLVQITVCCIKNCSSSIIRHAESCLSPKRKDEKYLKSHCWLKTRGTIVQLEII
jgi:hypothetical protein